MEHTDGEIRRFAEGSVKRVESVPSNLVFDQRTKNLYIADTGNRRIAMLDTASGLKASSLLSAEGYDGVAVMEGWDASVDTLVDGDAVGLEEPSGLHLWNYVLFVSDHATSIIWAFDVETGDTLDWLETGLEAGSLMGLAGDSEGNLYFVEAVHDSVLKISPKN